MPKPDDDLVLPTTSVSEAQQEKKPVPRTPEEEAVRRKMLKQRINALGRLAGDIFDCMHPGETIQMRFIPATPPESAQKLHLPKHLEEAQAQARQRRPVGGIMISKTPFFTNLDIGIVEVDVETAMGAAPVAPPEGDPKAGLDIKKDAPAADGDQGAAGGDGVTSPEK